MKFLVTVLFSLGSLAAFAAADKSDIATHKLSYGSAHDFEYYHGSGVFKKPSGKRRSFLASLTIRKLDDSHHNLIYGIYLDNKSVQYDIVLSEREGESFFDVMSRGETIGYGYCLGHKCHLEYSLMGYSIEETIKRHKRSNSLTLMGSKSKGDLIKSWKMSLKKIF